MIAWLVRSESARITAVSSGFPSTSTGACGPSTGTCTAASTTGEPATTATLDTTSSLRAAATRSWSAVPMSSLPCEATTCSPTIRRTARNSSCTGRHHSSVSKRSISVWPSTWLFSAACSGAMVAISVALASSASRCAFQAVSTLRRAASTASRACGLLPGSAPMPPIRSPVAPAPQAARVSRAPATRLTLLDMQPSSSAVSLTCMSRRADRACWCGTVPPRTPG